MALNCSLQSTARLGVRFAVQQGKSPVVALPTAEGLRAASRSESGTSENWVAQFSAHGQRLGKEAGFTFEEVKTLLRQENIATTSQVYGAPQMEAKRELQRRLVDFVKQRAELEGWKRERMFG